MADAIDSEREYEKSSALIKTPRVPDAIGVVATGLLAKRRRVASPKAVFLMDSIVVILSG